MAHTSNPNKIVQKRGRPRKNHPTKNTINTNKIIQKRGRGRPKKVQTRLLCSTCLKPLNLQNTCNFQPLTIPCGHKFHKRCINSHIYQNSDPVLIRTLSCPIPTCHRNLYFPGCKHPIFPKPLSSGAHPVWGNEETPEYCTICENGVGLRQERDRLEEMGVGEGKGVNGFEEFKRWKEVCREVEENADMEARFWVVYSCWNSIEWENGEELPYLWWVITSFSFFQRMITDIKYSGFE